MISLVDQILSCRTKAESGSSLDDSALAAIEKGRNLAWKISHNKHVAIFRHAMKGKGIMTSKDIAHAVGREVTSINISLRQRLIPNGHVRLVKKEARAGRGRPKHFYEWIGD